MSLMNHEEGRKVLLEVSDVLDEIKVPFFLMQGTALGAYRNKGFVKHERDIDLGILIENFPAQRIMDELMRRKYDVEAFVAPFDYIRTVVAWKNCIHVDLVGMIPFQDKRFTFGPTRAWTINEPYALVHRAEILENYQQVEIFGRTFNVPSPIEKYLRREYGKDWKRQRDDHVSRTRVYNFLKDNGLA